MALWDFSGWRPGGDPRPFVWPSRETLSGKLGGPSRSALDRSLRMLETEGWITPEICDGHEGWRLTPEPARAAPQLDLFAGEPVDNLGTDGEAVAEKSAKAAEKSAGSAQKSAALPFERHERQERTPDDDAARIWSTYEADRARMLPSPLPSSSPPRIGPPPLALRALIAEIGLPRVEAYARRSLELAADAVARDRQCAATLVLARADGREWHVKRVEAVERFLDPPRQTELVSRPPPPEPDPIDGRPLDRWELEAQTTGGDDAVRAMRAAPELTADAAARMLRDGAPWLRLVGGGEHV